MAVPPRVPCRWPQEGFQAAFRSLFPAGAVKFELPIVEDLLVQEPFHIYPRFLEDQGLPSWDQQPPTVASAYRRGIVRSGVGVQAGHHFSGRDPTQRVDMGMSQVEHLQAALGLASASPAGHSRLCGHGHQVRSSLDGGQRREPALQAP